MAYHPQPQVNYYPVTHVPVVDSSPVLESYPAYPVSRNYSPNAYSKVQSGQPWARPAQSHPERRASYTEPTPQYQAPVSDYHQPQPQSYQPETYTQPEPYQNQAQNEYPQYQAYTQVPPPPPSQSQSQTFGLYSPRRHAHHIEQAQVAQYQPFAHQQGWGQEQFDRRASFDHQQVEAQHEPTRFDGHVETNQYNAQQYQQYEYEESADESFQEPAAYDQSNYEEPSNFEQASYGESTYEQPANCEQAEYQESTTFEQNYDQSSAEQSYDQNDFASYAPQIPQPYGTLPLEPEQQYEAFTHSGRIPHGMPPSAPLPLAYPPQSAPVQSSPAQSAPALVPGTLQAKRDSDGAVHYTITDHTGAAIPTIVDKDGHHLTIVDHRGNYVPTYTVVHDGRQIRITCDAQGNSFTPDDHGNLVPLDRDLFAQQRMAKGYQDTLKARSESKMAVWMGGDERHQWGPNTRRRTEEHATDERMHAFHPMPESVRNYRALPPPPKKHYHSHSHSSSSSSSSCSPPHPAMPKCQPPVAGTFVPRLNPPVPPMPQPIVPSQAHERAPIASGSIDDKTAPKKPALACLFCRKRKIACGPPPPDSLDRTCNQCARRKQCCEYPTESRRGIRKPPKVDVQTEETAQPTVHKFVHGDANNLDNVVGGPGRGRSKRKRTIDE